MGKNTFSAEVREENNLVVIDLAGLIDARADATIMQAYCEAESKNTETIALNFSSVDYINSTGIALIVEMLAQARKSHKHLVVYGLNEHYLEIFQITRLADFMEILEDKSSLLGIGVSN
jgi:anti-anti-sigma factor